MARELSLARRGAGAWQACGGVCLPSALFERWGGCVGRNRPCLVGLDDLEAAHALAHQRMIVVNSAMGAYECAALASALALVQAISRQVCRSCSASHLSSPDRPSWLGPPSLIHP